jgi:phosphate transport system substrate-binding protein
MTRLALLSLLLLLLATCQAEPLPVPTAVPTLAPPAALRIGLTGDAGSLAELVTAGYPTARSGAIIAFVHGNSAALLADLDAGLLDAVLIHDIPANSHYWFNPVALDGLVVVVHPSNSLSGLSRGEVQAIFSGRTPEWSNLGDPNQAILLISRERGSGARTIFHERVLAEQRLAITAVIQPDNRSLMAAVAGEPAAIGYAMMGELTDQVKALALDGVAPTPHTTGDQSYPLTVPLYFVAPAEPRGELRAFLAWLQSEEGQSLLAGKYGRVR